LDTSLLEHAWFGSVVLMLPGVGFKVGLVVRRFKSLREEVLIDCAGLGVEIYIDLWRRVSLLDHRLALRGKVTSICIPGLPFILIESKSSLFDLHVCADPISFHD
jgi:hypothetical protein